ncbi:PAS domain-containing protein (plasmid) [Haloarcula sp. NS06]|uniref:PAS domain-containing protein n=1 Tax=Haloarcula sp. NS06 TaxID=3409688 RepID=UPI003DA7867E
MLGYDADDLIGHEGYEFVHPEDRERNADALETVLSDPSEFGDCRGPIPPRRRLVALDRSHNAEST